MRNNFSTGKLTDFCFSKLCQPAAVVDALCHVLRSQNLQCHPKLECSCRSCQFWSHIPKFNVYHTASSIFQIFRVGQKVPRQPVQPFAAKKKIPVERILQEPLYLTERGISYRYAMEQALATAGFAVKPFLEIGNTDVITHFIKQGFGISFLSEYVVKDDIADGRLAVLDVDLPPITMWSQLVYHKSKLLTPQISNDSR